MDSWVRAGKGRWGRDTGMVTRVMEFTPPVSPVVNPLRFRAFLSTLSLRRRLESSHRPNEIPLKRKLLVFQGFAFP